jgi:hypothetical protein
MKPASEALAYRIWALCQPRGWGMTLKDCAEELGENINRVRAVSGHKGWADRFKATAEKSDSNHPRFVSGGYAEMIAAIQSVIGHSRHEAAE